MKALKIKWTKRDGYYEADTNFATFPVQVRREAKYRWIMVTPGKPVRIFRTLKDAKLALPQIIRDVDHMSAFAECSARNMESEYHLTIARRWAVPLVR